jgi:hypothetical protein
MMFHTDEEDQVQAEEYQRQLEEEKQLEELFESWLEDYRRGVMDSLLYGLQVQFPIRSKYYSLGHKFGDEIYSKWSGSDVNK